MGLRFLSKLDRKELIRCKRRIVSVWHWENVAMLMGFKAAVIDSRFASVEEGFARIDLKHDGRLSLKDFKEAMDLIQAHVETSKLERIFELCDTDSDGYISQQDFLLLKEPRALRPRVSKKHIAEGFHSPTHELSFHMQTIYIESVAQKTLRLHENHTLFDFSLMSKLVTLHLRHQSYRAGTCGYDVARLPLSIFGIPDVAANPKAAKDPYWPNIEDQCVAI